MSRLQHSVDTPKKTHSITFEPPQYYQPQHPLFQQAEATFEKLVKGSPAPVKSIYIVLIKSGTLKPVGTISLHSSNITPEIKKEVKNLLATKHYALETPNAALVLIDGESKKTPYRKNIDGSLITRNGKPILDPLKCVKVKSRWSRKKRSKIKLVTAFKQIKTKQINDWLTELYLAVVAKKHAKTTATATRNYVLKISENKNLEKILTWDPILSKINMIINKLPKPEIFKDFRKIDTKIRNTALLRICLFLGKLIRNL